MDSLFEEEFGRRFSKNPKETNHQTVDAFEDELSRMFEGKYTKERGELVKRIIRYKAEIKRQRKRIPRAKLDQQESIRTRIKKLNQMIVDIETKIKALPIPENINRERQSEQSNVQ